MKLRILPLLLALCPAVPAAPTFLEGVSEAGGWYDVNKRSKWITGGATNSTVYDSGVNRDPYYVPASRAAYYNYTGSLFGGYKMDSSNDNSMCWAASAANTLQWWQDRKAQQAALPEGIPDGYSASHAYQRMEDVAQLAIYQKLYTNFSYSSGGTSLAGVAGRTYAGWEWWFNGYTPQIAQLGEYYDIAGKEPGAGGYWKDLGLTTDIRQNGNSYTNESTLFSMSLINADNYLDALTQPIRDGLATSLTLAGVSGLGMGHAVTLWGYEDAGDELYLYLTDSDDYYHGLVKYRVYADGGKVLLDTTDTHPEIALADGTTAFSTLNGCQLTEAYSLASPLPSAASPAAHGESIPEPATSTLALLSLTALAARRRRKG